MCSFLVWLAYAMHRFPCGDLSKFHSAPARQNRKKPLQQITITPEVWTSMIFQLLPFKISWRHMEHWNTMHNIEEHAAAGQTDKQHDRPKRYSLCTFMERYWLHFLDRPALPVKRIEYTYVYNYISCAVRALLRCTWWQKMIRLNELLHKIYIHCWM